MGKRKEMETEEEQDMDVANAHKKHKKHKKHKHKKKHAVGEEDSGGEINVTDEVEGDAKPAIKLKIKIGGQAVEEATGENKGLEKISSSSWEAGEEPLFTTKKPGDDTSDEEREWLDALEKGELDDNGEVKKSKDPSLLTARQRALLHGPHDDSLLELPSGYKTQELTEEQVQRRIQRAKKRREQAHEKREKDKKQTLDRLLKKQESKAKSTKQVKSQRKSQVPAVRYLNNSSGISISLPDGVEFPLNTDICKSGPQKQQCNVSGCKNIKKYSCSKTGVPLCSLQCYRKNLRLKGLGR